MSSAGGKAWTRRSAEQGIATHEANNFECYPYKDYEAARWSADAAKRAKQAAKEGTNGRRRRRDKTKVEIPVELGGHNVQQVASGKGWFCTNCKARTRTRIKLATQRCDRTSAKKWGLGEVKANELKSTWGSANGKGHSTLKSGSITWCGVCGCFAETRANGLVGKCAGGPPKQMGSGRRRAQRNRLRAGRHPVTGARLPAATRFDGSLVNGNGTYSQLRAKDGKATNGISNISLLEFISPVSRQSANRQVKAGMRRRNLN